jgi:hypothetical protein
LFAYFKSLYPTLAAVDRFRIAISKGRTNWATNFRAWFSAFEVSHISELESDPRTTMQGK